MSVGLQPLSAGVGKKRNVRTSVSGNQKQPMRTMLEGGSSVSGSPDVVWSVRSMFLTDSTSAAGIRSGFVRWVLQIVLLIPIGKVSSYGQVETLPDNPKNSCQVGKLLSLELGTGDEVP
jgi:hypothetical protein